MLQKTYIAIVSLGVCLGAHVRAQSTHHVDAHAIGPLHDGTSWCSAFLYLQQALSIAQLGDTIRVAEGVYAPSSPGLGDPRKATFELKNGVIIRGGYAGCGAADPDEQDHMTHETVLSGDLWGNDGADFTNQVDNARHVVTAPSTALFTVLEGFTIVAGNADGVFDNGGGMTIDQVSPTVIDCTFRGNSASRGGGVYNDQGSPFFTGCVFEHNRATFGLEAGGGLYTSQGNPTMRNCLFLNNVAGIGGGMTTFMGSTNVENCTVTGNEAFLEGGGVFSAGELFISDSILWDNSAMNGANTGESAQITRNGEFMSVRYTIIQGKTGSLCGPADPCGEANLGDDPLFAPGPLGCYYLSHSALGGGQSPAVDAGSALASVLGVGSLTTRRDELADADTVDLGYHHPITGDPLLMGDVDRNDSVNLADFAAMQREFTGESLAGGIFCSVLDFDVSGDIDLDDYAAFKAVLTGP